MPTAKSAKPTAPANKNESLHKPASSWLAIAIVRWPAARGRRRNQTATSNFGHFCAEVPKSLYLYIGAYPRVLLIGAVPTGNAKPLQVATFTDRQSRRRA